MISSCDKVKSVTNFGVKCDNATAKEVVAELFSKNVAESASERIKELINNENITIDMGKLRSALSQITFNVTDIRTNNSDPNSKKEYCVTQFVVKIPAKMVQDADLSRDINGENNSAQQAIMSDLIWENNQLKKDLEYFVQPTDDAKKVYVQLEGGEAMSYFVRDIVIDSLIKSARQNAAEIAKQEEANRIAEQNANEQEYQNLLVTEANASLNQANENLNLVWNATTKEVRDQLLDEQRLWFKKRNLECKLDSTDVENLEVHRLNCETNMTVERTNQIRQKIYYLE